LEGALIRPPVRAGFAGLASVLDLSCVKVVWTALYLRRHPFSHRMRGHFEDHEQRALGRAIKWPEPS
jgi:hypothetical protein